MSDEFPLGVKPFGVWVELRKQEVNAAIHRFDEAEGKHPELWDQELVLLEELSSHPLYSKVVVKS